jgi:hypothetical protein
MFGANPIQHITEYLSICLSIVVAISCYFFQDKKIYGMEVSTGKILEENLVQSAFHQTLVDEFTFQQDNNPKHKAKIYTGVAYQE